VIVGEDKLGDHRSMTRDGASVDGLRRALDPEDLTTLSRGLARARSRGELLDRFVTGIAELGVSCCVLAAEADQARILTGQLSRDTKIRLDEALGRPMADALLPIDASDLLRLPARHRAAVFRREPAVAVVGRLVNLSYTQETALRRLPEISIAGLPIVAGDDLIGVVLAWHDHWEPQALAVLELLAGQIGPLWRLLEGRPQPEKVRRRRGGRPTPQVQNRIRSLLTPGKLRAALQPVIRLADRTVLAYEALCRFPSLGALQSPDELFAAAAACGLETELDLACLRAGLTQGRKAQPANLFINVGLRTLLAGDGPSERFARLAEEAGVDPATVVLEFSEREPVPDVARLRRAAAELRERGFRIAVDDAGAGHASMFVVAELRPEFIKVDRSLIHAIHADAARQALVVSLLSFAAHINARLIAEGIEDERELVTLASLGVQYGQGFHLGAPAMVAPAPTRIGTVEVEDGWFNRQNAGSFPRQRLAVPSPAPPARRRRAATQGREPLAHALSHAASTLQSEHDPQRILEVIVRELPRVVPFDDLVIYAADYEQHRFVPLVATGSEAPQVLDHAFSMDTGITGWTFALGVPQNVGNAAAHPHAGHVPGTPIEDESTMYIPLIAGDRKLGVLNCSRGGLNRFTKEELEAASLFAHTAAAAWRNAQLYAELEERATTDPLTGLLNSRWLRDAGEREVEQARRSGQPLAVLLVDLDHFKEVNDSAGHAAGDTVLLAAARQLSGAVRAGDAAARLGGEEFLVILRDADAQGALRVAAAVRDRLTRVRLPAGCSISRLTASIGIAAFPEHGDHLEELVRAADVAMYAGKRAGRDRAVVADTLPLPAPLRMVKGA
jgi:diguanylate cyclase (GGDEF)-like protein